MGNIAFQVDGDFGNLLDEFNFKVRAGDVENKGAFSQSTAMHLRVCWLITEDLY
jgi:hypothetical protein